MSYNYATEGNTITANNDFTFYDPTNASSIYILESIDAAAASLQVGVDKQETQFIEIGSSDITTTIYGVVNMTHALNVSSLSVNNGFSVAGQTTLANVSVNNLTVTGMVDMGSTATSTTINGGVIRQVVPCNGGGTVETVIGNTTSASSMSTTFNRKNTTSGAVGALNPLPCYTIVLSDQWISQYFEIIVSGSNGNCGAYSYKGCFSLTSINIGAGNTIYTSSVSTLFSYNLGTGSPVITFNPASPTAGVSTLTLYIQTSSINVPSPLGYGASSNQNFMSTLVAYPTISISSTLLDCAITAI